MLRPIKGDRRSKEYSSWQRWLSAAAELQSDWHLTSPEDSPFAYNETASVSFLCCAAGRAGYVALTDYRVEKLLGQGRCDMWLYDRRYEWAFEFKQLMLYGVPRTRVQKKWNEALQCANDLKKDDGVKRVAGIILSTYWSTQEKQQRCYDSIINFALSESDFAWELNPLEVPGVEAIIAFKIID